MRSIERTGRTVEEAIREALNELGAERDAAHVEVLEEGSKGLFGLLSRQARVRVSVKDTEKAPESEEAPIASSDTIVSGLESDTAHNEPVDVDAIREQAVARACEFVRGVAERLGLEIGVETREGEEDIIHVNITGSSVGLIIGHHGQTLDALQYLTNVVANQNVPFRVRLVLDAEGYRIRREATLTSLAERMADKVISQKRKAVLEPMSALERRIIHLTLQTSDKVTTYSEGEDPHRRVVIAPK